MRPETTYYDLRNADGNTGNVEENKSLYWHPTVYRVETNNDGSTTYKKSDIYLTSAYYIWTTGQAIAFPDGFKMVAGFLGVADARANFECVGGSVCSNQNDEEACMYKEFPTESCAELEVSMAFPTCWDGMNIDSEDHMSHVSYDIEGGRFDGECPSTHPVKLPEIQLFFRILPYPGGKHVFADGTSFYHADYFSGWDSKELQNVLDKCENYSDAASPDAWCENFVTFRDAPKTLGEDDNIVGKLKGLQPNPFDTTTITDEVIDNTSQLPRGACTGTLKPEGPTAPTPTAPTPTAPTPTAPTPTAGNLCPIGEFLGRTFYVPFSNYCWKIELFAGGVIAADTSDSKCSNNVHSASLTVSEFEYGNGSQAYFKSIGPNGFGGQIEFSKDQSVSDVVLVPKSVGNGMFLLGLIFPSCDMGPSYPCQPSELLGKTLYVPVLNLCVEAEVFGNGLLSPDLSDSTCSNTVHNSPFSVGTFDRIARGNQVHFIKNGVDGWSGYFEISEDSTVTELQVSSQVIDMSAKEFIVGLTYPSCANI